MIFGEVITTCLLMCVLCLNLQKWPKKVSKNASKLFLNGNLWSNKGTNRVRVMLDNDVLMNPTWVEPFWIATGIKQMTKCTWLIKPSNFECVFFKLVNEIDSCSFCLGWCYKNTLY